ncbi:MAG: lipid-A-disaccharide synthase [Spirochaetota bacterium]
MKHTQKIFIMAGEASGDMHGGLLVNAIKKLSKDIGFYGVGGENLNKEKVKLIYNYKDFASMGMIEPLLKLSFYKKALNNILEFVLSKGINTVILIDFPGFNLRLAEKLKKSNIQIIYYISPQIWAWHYSRIEKIKKYVDAMIVLYPFEEEIYRKEGVKVFFAGNPLVDLVSSGLSGARSTAAGSTGRCIGILPGSRLSEVKRHLPAMLDAAVILQKKYGASFLLPLIKGEAIDFVKLYMSNPAYSELKIRIISDNTYKAIKKCDFIIISSGTATLETAIIGKPMIVVYKIDLFSELIARLVLKIKNIALVNIVAGKRICTELLQRNVTGKKIFLEVSRYLDNKSLLNDMIKNIADVKRKLGKPNAINRIAKIVLSLLNDQ